MSALHFVHFEDPHAFLEATKQFDDSFMRFCLGSLYEYLANSQAAATNSPMAVYLSAIFKGADLL